MSESDSESESVSVTMIPTSKHNGLHDTSPFQEPVKNDGKKAIVSVVYFGICMTINISAVNLARSRLPDRAKHPPLPDVFLDNIARAPWAQTVSEACSNVLFLSLIVLSVCHKYGSIVARRYFALAGSLYLFRSLTLVVTALPTMDLQYPCNRSDGIPEWIMETVLSYDNKGTINRACGDYIFSGHTLSSTLTNLFIVEYTSERLWPIRVLSWILTLLSIFFLMHAHAHYSVDVVLAFYITCNLSNLYHLLANNRLLESRDYKRIRYLIPLFNYLESDCTGTIPNEYRKSVSLPWKWWLRITGR